ncbi:MAG: transporter substrate-binding domain-containing protein [Synergistaceae bacterium]|jgi:L-cystine transport system substrate-binding protein|nr:transporter substrate-binding domain-containing protein [Synergistaceae bacterium]
MRCNKFAKIIFALFVSLFCLAQTAAAADEVVIVATEAAFPPFNMFGEKGEIIGYDVAVTKAIDELIPGVTFKLEPVPWESFFLGLDSGRYDIVVDQMNWTEARAEKYLFGEVPYFYATNAIIFKKGRDDIKSLKDLHGKRVAAAVGSFNTTWIEDYNEKNKAGITIEYYDAEAGNIMKEIVADRVDAFLNHPVLTKYIADSENLPLDYVISPEFGVKPAYYMFNNNANGQKYQKLFDEALKKLAADGTLTRLSVEWCGADYTTEDAAVGME